MANQTKIFLFGFCFGVGDDLYHLLNQDYNVCHWIGDNKEFSDDIYSYMHMRCEQVTPDKMHRREYIDFYNKNFSHYLLLVQRRGLFWKDFFEIRNSFNILFYRLSHILQEKQPDVVIFSNIPHEGADFILYKLCKLKNINTLIFFQSLFPNVLFAQTTIDDFGLFRTIQNHEVNNEVYELKPLNLFYMKEVNKKEALAKEKLIVRSISKIKTQLFKFSKLLLLIMKKFKKITFSRILNELFKMNNNKAFKANYSKFKMDDVELQHHLDKKIIYVPLHLQPELTTSAIGGHYEDQLSLIEYLSCEVSDEYMIIVKENPKQSGFQRGELFFKRLSVLDNVIFANTSVSSNMLIEKSELVALVSGTAGWEAIQAETKCMIFGQAWYASFPGCYSIKDYSISDVLLEYPPSYEQVQRYYQDFMSSKYSGIVDALYGTLVTDFTFAKNAKILLNTIDTILSDENVKW